MAKCRTCQRFVIFGGKRDGDHSYCSQKCLDEDILRETGEMIPRDLLDERVRAIHLGPCPRCHRDGPVDVHRSYSLWTLLYFTQTRSCEHLVCRSCARQSQFWASIRSMLLGPWGPFGILLTPVQIVRNVAAMIGGPPSYAPSALLVQVVRRHTAEQILAHAATRRKPAGEGIALPAEDVSEDERGDDRGVGLDDELGRVDGELAPGDLLVGHRA